MFLGGSKQGCACATRQRPPYCVLHEVFLFTAALLQDHCRKRLGDMELRLCWFSLEEVRRRNAAGEWWCIVRGCLWL